MTPSRLRSELPLIFASLFISFVIWLIAEQANLDTDRLNAAVQLKNVPDMMMVAQPSPVRVNVRYPEEMKNRVVDINFSVPIDISRLVPIDPAKWDNPAEPREIKYQLRPADVHSELIPTVQVLEVQPKEIELSIRLRTQTVKVKVQTSGELPKNQVLVAPPQSEPAELLVTGSADALAALAQGGNILQTEPVDQSALQASTQVFPHLQLPKGIILLGRPDNRIPVNIALSEKPVRQTLTKVPIALVTITGNLTARVQPSTADVVLEGPASLLTRLTPGDIVFSTARDLVEQPGQTFEVGLEARLKSTAPADIAQHVRIVEVNPSRISVEYVPLDKQDKAADVISLRPGK